MTDRQDQLQKVIVDLRSVEADLARQQDATMRSRLAAALLEKRKLERRVDELKRYESAWKDLWQEHGGSINLVRNAMVPLNIKHDLFKP